MKIDAGFESQNDSHMALFSAPMCFCCQRITRHNANYAQMPGCPLCSILDSKIHLFRLSTSAPLDIHLVRVPQDADVVNVMNVKASEIRKTSRIFFGPC